MEALIDCTSECVTKSEMECTCDPCLLARMRSANAAERKQGWEAWYRRDAQVVGAYIERRAHSWRCAEHSEDLLHDCFVIGFKKISGGYPFEEGTSLCAYLIGIAKNLLRSTARLQRKAGDLLSEEESSGDVAIRLASSSLSIDLEDTFYLEEVMGRVREAYKHRSNLYQHVVTGFYGEGKSSGELAAELGKSAVHIRAMAHRAVGEIRQYLECQYRLQLSTEAIRACLEAI